MKQSILAIGFVLTFFIFSNTLNADNAGMKCELYGSKSVEVGNDYSYTCYVKISPYLVGSGGDITYKVYTRSLKIWPIYTEKQRVYYDEYAGNYYNLEYKFYLNVKKVIRKTGKVWVYVKFVSDTGLRKTCKTNTIKVKVTE